MRFLKHSILLSVLVITASGCMTASDHAQNLQSTKEREMTVGIVQKTIYAGMSQVEVLEALGSPNIVTQDADGKETWVYDKIATEASYSGSRSSVSGQSSGAATPGYGLVLGLAGAGFSQEAGAVSTTQKTLTVILKFNYKKLDSFSYHSSKF